MVGIGAHIGDVGQAVDLQEEGKGVGMAVSSDGEVAQRRRIYMQVELFASFAFFDQEVPFFGV